MQLSHLLTFFLFFLSININHALAFDKRARTLSVLADAEPSLWAVSAQHTTTWQHPLPRSVAHRTEKNRVSLPWPGGQGSPPSVVSPYPWAVSAQRPLSQWGLRHETPRTEAPNSGTYKVDDLETLRNRVIADMMAPEVDEAHIERLVNTIRQDGSWPGINYEDTSRTGFEHARHLDNMVDLGWAYKKSGTAFYKNRKVKNTLFAALDFWFVNDFICDIMIELPQDELAGESVIIEF